MSAPNMYDVPTGRVRGVPPAPDRGNVWTCGTCGTCGAVVGYAHVARHVAWHAQTAAAAFPATVANEVSPLINNT